MSGWSVDPGAAVPGRRAWAPDLSIRQTALVLAALAWAGCDNGTSPPTGGVEGLLEEGTAGRWTTSTPASRGLDESVLVELTERVDGGEWGEVSSVLVLRGGVLVYERYLGGWGPGDLHPVYSVTKSVTSLLMGIAAEEDVFASLDDPVMDLLPSYETVENWSPAKEEITLRHVLQMRAGFEWDELSTNYMNSANPVGALAMSDDWIKFVLDLPLAHPPGTRFAYNSGVSVLMAGVLQTALDISAEAYAADRLFAPLAIEEWLWAPGAGGITNSGWGLRLRPRDMAALGHMVLERGGWEGSRVVPPDWIDESGVRSTEFVDGTGYGYQWWLGRDDGARQALAAWGYGGQFIVAIPSLDMVMVSTAENYAGGGFDPYSLASFAYRAAGQGPP